MRYYYDYSFPIGNLTIEEDGHGICGIYFGTKILEGEKKNTELIRLFLSADNNSAIITVF